MNKEQLDSYFLSQIESGEMYIILSQGKAKYKMNRGSFTTKDHIKNRHKLNYKCKSEHGYLFTDGEVKCVVTLEVTDAIKLRFSAPKEYNRFSLHLNTFEDEHIYGCGEQYTHLDLKGQKVDIWVSEHQQVMKIAKKFLREKVKGVNPDYQAPYRDHQTYYSSPGFTSSKNYFVYCHEDSYGQLDFRKKDMFIKFRQVPSSITIITANDQIELSKKVTKLVGIQPRVPDYVNDGVIIATQGGTDVMLKKYEKLKEKGAKISGIWCQDWSGQIITKFGSQVYWNWEVDDKLYHDLKETIAKLNAEGVHFLGYINTFLKENAHLYEEAKSKDYLVKKKDGSVYLIQSTTFNAGIVDLTNPQAYEWYKNIIKKNMIGFGLSGWMADFGEYLPTDAVVYGGDAEKLHNKWPTLWAKCNYDAINESGKLGKIFYFSRAAYGHTIQYTSSMWNGDQHVDYSDEYGLGSVIPATLSMTLSGVGVNHSDIGGYTTVLHMKRDAELFLRWSEMNIFTPAYRCHEGNRPNSNVQFDDERVIDEFANNTKIFAKLKPYRVEVEREYYEEGIPCNRPLFFHYDENECYTNKKEFMFGSEILCAPVLRKDVTKQKVYLPKGNWISIYDGKEYEGGQIEVDAPLGSVVAFYEKGCKHEELFKTLFKGE